jgi:hypothetical protein
MRGEEKKHFPPTVSKKSSKGMSAQNSKARENMSFHIQ